MENKNNPWKNISLSDYENHMSFEGVRQQQALNKMMKDQFGDYPLSSAIILGVASGNGLEHIDREKYKKVYGIDINEEYLNALKERYSYLNGVLECILLNLTSEYDRLPDAQLLIADLLIEYIGYETFGKAVKRVKPDIVSCIIQKNTDTKAWVSLSPYIHSFDCLNTVHHEMDEDELDSFMEIAGYKKINRVIEELPNAKAFVRTDYKKDTDIKKA